MLQIVSIGIGGFAGAVALNIARSVALGLVAVVAGLAAGRAI